ncbi:MAG: hypothetical protein H0T91_01405 [Propionibacteriaceae bacterium]|nr:hypothetical protein [Propionibacteriaceae bacterium]
MGAQRIPRLDQDRMRQWVAFAEEAQQSRHIDDPLIHLPPLRLPRHGVDELVEERVSSAEPAGQQVDPGAPA